MQLRVRTREADAIDACCDCGVSVCDLHAEFCDLCHETYCSMCFLFHMDQPPREDERGRDEGCV
jgi:hypothetical protein